MARIWGNVLPDKLYKFCSYLLNMGNFLWRRVNEEEQEQIKLEAKEIMDRFAKALETAAENLEESYVKRDEQLREESRAVIDESFRKIFFQNTQHEKDYVKAEKGKWK